MLAADLHLNCVSVLQRSIKNSWGIYDLPPEVLVVCVTHKQRLGGEGIWLHIHISPCHTCMQQALLQQDFGLRGAVDLVQHQRQMLWHAALLQLLLTAVDSIRNLFGLKILKRNSNSRQGHSMSCYYNACWVQKGLTVHEATLADIGVSTDQEGAGIGVNGRQPAHVLPHLL